MEAMTTAGQPTDARKSRIVDALHRFAHQRPGLDPRNYISGWNDTEGRRAYFSEARSITRDLHHFRELMRAVELSGIGADDLIRAADRRLTIHEGDKVHIEYCTGQYWPTEYRPAACRVLVSALWDYWRDRCGCETGDKIRAEARRSLSRGVASRWFQ